MLFYPEVKKYLSPSSLATWHNSRSAFIKSYFKGEKFGGNSATEAGTKIHGLLEAGFLKAEKRYGNGEQELVIPFRDTGVNILGKPDDYGLSAEVHQAVFVDYKSGKENDWKKSDLAEDLKMKVTAWLVWNKVGRPEGGVMGFIEWFGTKWDNNTKELVPTNEDHAVIHYFYSVDELNAFEEVIAKTIADVNASYDKFQHCELLIDTKLAKEYAELDAKVKELKDQYENSIEDLEDRMEEIKEAIGEQLEFTGSLNQESEFGTFFIKETKSFEYPDDIELQTESAGIMTLAVGEEVVSAVKAVKKNYELTHTPNEVKRTVQFKAKKTK